MRYALTTCQNDGYSELLACNRTVGSAKKIIHNNQILFLEGTNVKFLGGQATADAMLCLVLLETSARSYLGQTNDQIIILFIVPSIDYS